MTSDELKGVLLDEHQKEKKISIRNYVLVSVLTVILLAVVFIFFSDKIALLTANVSADANTPNYIKYIYPLILLSILVYPTKILYNSLKRPKVIEEVVSSFEQGKNGDHFHDEKIYKTTIPFLKIDFKLNPFHYLSFMIDGKMVKLPVPLSLIPDIKSTLSGADMSKVYAVRDELYDTKKSESTEEKNIPLKTFEEFKQFAQNTLSGNIGNMEKGRKKTVRYLVISTVFIVIVLGAFMYFNFKHANDNVTKLDGTVESIKHYQESQSNQTTYTLIGFGILFMCSLFYAYYQKKKYANVAIVEDGSNFTTFKEQIFKKMVAFINPTFEYVKNSHIGLQEITSTQLFIDKNYDLSGNDLIIGKHQGVPFQYSDITLTYIPNFSNKESKQEVFSGQYFVAKFNKNFSEPLYVFSKSSLKGFFTNNDIHIYLNTYLPKVNLEDPEFAKNFDVYCNDQVMARYILSTSLMQRIKDLSIYENKAQLFLSFYQNKVSILNNTMKDKFETGILTSIKPELLESFYQDLHKQLSMIEDLKLNMTIWKN